MKIEEYSTIYPQGISPIISITPADGLGVRIARLHASSGKFNDNEAAENMFLDKNIPDNKTKKWCYNQTPHYAIIELSDFYDIDKFVIADCKSFEPDNPNFPAYTIYVSTTGTDDQDWVEVVSETGQADRAYKINEINPVKARYIKFQPKDIATVRIYSFEVYGRKSFESAHDANLISVGKSVTAQNSSPDIHQSALNLFDGNLTATNAKWTSSNGDKYVIVDLEGNYTISEFKLYDAGSAGGSNQNNIDGYKISTGSDGINWDVVADENGQSAENIKTKSVNSSQSARYVKLEIPEDRMGNNKQIDLYEFEIYGKLDISENNADLKILNLSSGKLFPDFEGNRTYYMLDVSKETDQITIQASALHENATISGDIGEKTLQIGENKFSITVKSANNSTTKVYYIQVNRASLSAVAGLLNLSVEEAEILPGFGPSTFEYRTEVKSNTVTIHAETTSPYTILSGHTGKQTLHDGANYLTVTAISEDGTKRVNYQLTIYNTSRLISVSSPDGKGKRIANIHSYSGMTGVHENPFHLIRGWKDNLTGNNMKWCDTSATPWVIFSLTDIYTIDHIEIRDCKMLETDWPNMPDYRVYVSTTDTMENSWTEIINEQGVSSLNEKIKSIDPVNARYVKFIPGKEDNAIRIYGFDIYGEFSQAVDHRGNIAAGKTIVNYSACTNDMLTPANIADENWGTSWEFNRGNAFVEIDLEASYDLGKFVLIDSLNWINGYQVSVSNTGNSNDWKEVARTAFQDRTIVQKEVVLSKAESARYIRLEIPLDNQQGTNHIRQFEVYEYKSLSGNNTFSDSDENFIVYPNPVIQGDRVKIQGKGIAKVYSLNAHLIHEQDIRKNPVISTTNWEPGNYIIQIQNGNTIKQAKLIIK
jgi:hypothetical protein